MVADTTIQVTAPTVNIEASTAITLESDSITFGEAGDTDIVLNFNANTADGVITWMEDEDYFKFSDEIFMNSTEKILFGDSGTFIHKSSDGVLTILADTTVDIIGAVAFNGALSGIVSIYAQDLIIGEDSETAIDFGTANEIDFKINNTTELTLDASALYPTGDAGLDLGTASLEFKDAFFDGTVTSDAFAGPLTGNVTGDVTGTSSKVTVTDSTSNTNFPVVFHDENDALLDDTGALRYNPSTGQLLVPNLTVAGTTTQVNTVTMNAQNAVVFEGATADAHETTLSIVDPTGDHTQYLVNQGGYIPVLAAATTTQISSTPEELNILDGATVVVGEINALDLGSTAVGTAIASKAVILDSNKDYTGIRNLTISGTFSDGNYTFDTDGNVSGLGTVGSGNITSSGTVQGTTITATTAFVPDASDGAALGTTSLEFSDLYLADEAVIGFGDDQEVTLTHVHNAGLLLSSTDKLQFGDAGTFIHQSADGVLTIESDTTVDINGAVVFNGALTGITNITLSGTLSDGNYTFDTSGNVSGLGTVASGAITSSGVVTATGFTIGSAAITETELEILDGASVTTAELNLIDGGTARGTTAIADGDGVLINDDGTMRMTTVQTLAAYLDDEITAMPNLVTTGTIGTGVWEGTDVAVAHGGTGASSLTDGGVLLGSGTGAITAMAVLADGEMIVGDGTTDPEAESGATLRTSIGVGTGDSPQFTGIELGHASDTTIARSGSGAITVEGTQVLLAGAQTGVTTILNASTKIGRDADNLVDFATTDNNIIFRANGENQLTLSDGALTPSSNAIVDLGTDALEFKDAYFDGNVEADAYTVNGTTLAEYISDTTGAMFSSNTETGLSATYQDGDNTIDLAIAADQTTIESIYATDLIMGEDSQTAIDFGTANEIDFKVDNANRLTIDSTRMYHYGTSGTDVGDNPDSQVRFYDQSGVAQNNGAGLTLGGQPNSGENWNYVALKAYKANGTADNVEAGLKIYTIDNSTRQLEQRMQINGEGQVAIGDAFDSPDTLLDIRSLDNTTAYHDIITFGVGTTAAGSANHPARFGIGSGFTDNDRTYWSLNWKDNGDHDAGGAGAKDEAGWTAVQIALKNSVDDNEADTGILFRAVEDDDTGDLATKMVMLPNGNFGIGDTSPTYKLDVNGTGRFTGTATFDGNIDVDGTVGIDSSPADETVSGITASLPQVKL